MDGPAIIVPLPGDAPDLAVARSPTQAQLLTRALRAHEGGNYPLSCLLYQLAAAIEAIDVMSLYGDYRLTSDVDQVAHAMDAFRLTLS